MKPAERRVVVLGAGPAGLASAHVLAKRGVAVTILERNDRVGGLCVTEESSGFRFDLGGHRWFTKNPELHRWFLELMDGELVTVQRKSRIYFDGRYFDYPISIKNVLDNAGILPAAAAMISYLWAATKDVVKKTAPSNMREAYVAQFGTRLYEMFFRRYSEKVWGCRCEEMSPDWVSQRSKGLSILTALKDALVKTKDVVSLVDEFVYPRNGYERICVRMAEDITRSGGEIRLGSSALELRTDEPGKWTVTHGGPGGPLEATDIISTIPLTHLCRMVRPAATSEVLAAADGLRFRDLITVTVMLRKPRVTDDTWLYVHDEGLIFARLHEPKNWSPAMVPSPDTTSVVCECFCSFGDTTWSLPDEQISRRVVADLEKSLEFIHSDEVIDTCVVRSRFAYPVYDLGYRPKINAIYSFVHETPGLHVVGRGGTFRYNNADHSIEMGQLLAKELLGEARDHMSVNTEAAYHEEIRVTQASVRR